MFEHLYSTFSGSYKAVYEYQNPYIQMEI